MRKREIRNYRRGGHGKGGKKGCKEEIKKNTEVEDMEGEIKVKERGVRRDEQGRGRKGKGK